MINKLLSGAFLSLLIAVATAQPPSIGGFNVYFGDLHNHSNVTDGTGTPAAAYNYAKNIAHLDFFGLSDHSESITPAEWTDIRTQADACNQDGVFSSFYGFEWSSDRGYGHINVINTDDYCAAGAPTNTFEGLVIWLASRPNGIAFFNHPGKEDYGIEFNHLTTTPSDQLVGMELWNQGDNFNVYYYNNGYYSGDNNKGYFDEANNRGWRVGASGAGDDHNGTWGTAHPYRMAVLSNNLTRANLLAAMQARRFFSTMDKNLSLSFKINGMEMGSSMPGGNYPVHIQAADADGEIFTKVILYNKNHDSSNIWSLNTSAVDVSMNLDTSVGDYYYVKVTQADGDEAISSPIWISGSNSNKYPFCSISAPVNGAALTAPANIIIDASALDPDGSISKVEFYEGTTKLGEDLTSPYSFNLNNVTPGIYGFTVKATDNSGATSTSSVISVPVIPRPITVTADDRTKIYGGSDPALSYRITAGSLAGTDAFTGALTRDPGENVGSYLIRQGTLSLNSNYAITYSVANFSITAKSITVRAGPKSKTYGNADPALTYQIISGTLVGTDAFSGALIRDTGENFGTYPIRQGTLSLNSNYLLNFIGANLNILARFLSVAAAAKQKVYGDADPGLTYQITFGTLAGTDAFSGDLIRDAGENVGTYLIKQGTLALNGNYILNFTPANFTITARSITVTTEAQSKIYGNPDPVLTWQVTSGTLAGTDSLSGELTREPGEDVGTYDILQGTLTSDSNYTLTYAGAELGITPRQIKVNANARKKVFGESDPDLTYQITSGNLVGEDEFKGTLTRLAGEDIGTYPITIGDLALDSNYILTFTGADFTITASFEMTAYPNPFSDHITFELELDYYATIKIEIFNLNGTRLTTVFSGNVDGEFISIDYNPENLPIGLLIYQLTKDGTIIATGKVIHKP